MHAEKELLNQIAAHLKRNNLFLATAESCTGGLLGHLITNIPGSSEFYLGGQIVYSNAAKRLWLGVPPEVLDLCGAVSRETVLALAYSVRKAFIGEVDPKRIVGFSISGIAGPGGGSPEKPVGTVWMGLSTNISERAYYFLFDGSREEIKQQTVFQALEILTTDITLI
jgi:nicotinamide-nucleotide amidase